MMIDLITLLLFASIALAIYAAGGWLPALAFGCSSLVLTALGRPNVDRKTD